MPRIKEGLYVYILHFAAFSPRAFDWWRSLSPGEGLPFAEVLREEEIREAFAAANACFAEDEGDTYTPAVTLWAWLSQTLARGSLRSCAAAVSRVGVLCVMLDRQPPSPDTGDYCRARAKLPERVLRQLVYEAGDALESGVPRTGYGWGGT